MQRFVKKHGRKTNFFRAEKHTPAVRVSATTMSRQSGLGHSRLLVLALTVMTILALYQCVTGRGRAREGAVGMRRFGGGGGSLAAIDRVLLMRRRHLFSISALKATVARLEADGAEATTLLQTAREAQASLVDGLNKRISTGGGGGAGVAAGVARRTDRAGQARARASATRTARRTKNC